MHEASNTREGILKIATITCIILPFGTWASTCIPSSLCAMRLLLTGACGGGGLSSNSARLQWPTNVTSFKRKEHLRSWNADGELTCLVFRNLTYPEHVFYRWGNRSPWSPEFTQVLMQTEDTTPVYQFSVPAAFSCAALHLQLPHADLSSMPLSLILPWLIQRSQAPVPTGTSEVLWVKCAEWRMTDTAGDHGKSREHRSCPTWKAPVLTAGVWACYGLQIFQKSQKSPFLFETSQAGQVKENLQSLGHLPAAWRLQPPL